MKGILFLLAMLPRFANAQTVLPVGNQALASNACKDIVAESNVQLYQVTQIEGEGSHVRFAAIPTAIREPLHTEEAIFYKEEDKALYIERETDGKASYQVFRGNKLIASGELHLANEIVPAKRWKDGRYTVTIQDNHRKLVRELIVRDCDN